jgi:hypothetical protein
VTSIILRRAMIGDGAHFFGNETLELGEIGL